MKNTTFTNTKRLPDYLDELTEDEAAITPPPELRRRVLESFAPHPPALEAQLTEADEKRGFLTDLALRLRGWRDAGPLWGPTGYSIAVLILVAGVLLTTVGLRHLPLSWGRLVDKSAGELALVNKTGAEEEGLVFDQDHTPELLLGDYADSEWWDPNATAYFPPDSEFFRADSAGPDADFADFSGEDSGVGVYPYPGVRVDPAGFEYLIYVEVPAEQFALWYPHNADDLAGIAGADESADQSGADGMKGRGMAGIVVGDDGLVQAIHRPSRPRVPAGWQNN